MIKALIIGFLALLLAAEATAVVGAALL